MPVDACHRHSVEARPIQRIAPDGRADQNDQLKLSAPLRGSPQAPAMRQRRRPLLQERLQPRQEPNFARQSAGAESLPAAALDPHPARFFVGATSVATGLTDPAHRDRCAKSS
jgi:hypothetical protein